MKAVDVFTAEDEKSKKDIYTAAYPTKPYWLSRLFSGAVLNIYFFFSTQLSSPTQHLYCIDTLLCRC